MAITLASSLAIFTKPTPASAATNSTVNFQARLQTASGAIVADGNYNVEFKLYTTCSSLASDGSNCDTFSGNVWTEDHYNSASHGIAVANGYLTTSLGSVTSFPSSINWDQELWLTMNIGGTTTGAVSLDGEMSPALKLTAQPYALSAGQLQTTSGSNTSKLNLQGPTVGSQTFSILDQGAAGTYNICVQGATSAKGGCAPTTGGTGYIQNSTSVQTGASFFIQPTSGNIAGVIKANGSGDLLQFQNSSGNVLSKFNSNGDLAVGGTSSTASATALQVQKTDGTAVLSVDTASSLTILRGANSDAVLGSELTNTSGGVTDFTNASWTTTGWTATSTNATHATGNTNAIIYTGFTPTAGTTYQVTFTVSGLPPDGEYIRAEIGGTYGQYIYGNTSQTQIITATNTNTFRLVPSGNWDGTISNITVQSIMYSNAALVVQNSTGSTVLEVHTSTANSNTLIGLEAGQSNTTGSNNSAYGSNALQSNTTGSYNSAYGSNALQSNTTGSYNYAAGYGALQLNTTGLRNTANGYYALQSNTSGSSNTANGYYALKSNTSGSGNTANGQAALQSNTTGSNNSAIGYIALTSNTTGSSNTANGYYALQSNTIGSSNTATGTYALSTNTTGSYNTAYGSNALRNLTSPNGLITATVNNGGNAKFTTSSTGGLVPGNSINITGTTSYNGSRTIASVDDSTHFTISSAYSTADATGSWAASTPTANTAFGYAAGRGANGSYVAQGGTLFGYYTGYALQSGADYNTLIGYSAGSAITTGNTNLLLGKNAGLNLTTGSNNIIIGSVNAATATGNNQLSIGGIINGDLATGAVNFTGDVTIAAQKTITMVGGATAQRPASPTEGQLYFDNSTHQLLQYNGSKWVSDRSTATKIVAMGTTSGCSGTSPVASANPDGADYVVTSCTSAQTTINNAINALPSGGGTVYLMEGTYIIDGSIIPTDNVVLRGAGSGTITKVKDTVVPSGAFYAVSPNISAGSAVTVSDLTLDGNTANNGSATIFGVYGLPPPTNLHLNNITVQNFNYAGASLGTYTEIQNSVFKNNVTAGIVVGTSSTVTNNTFQNTRLAIWVSGNYVTVTGNTISGGNSTAINVNSAYNTISGNTVNGASVGIAANGSQHSTFTSNTVVGNTSYGIQITTGSNNIISSNKVHNNGGDGIAVTSSASETLIANNNITDTAGTTYAISINAAAQNTYLSGNTYSGTGASSINDVGAGTIYANQQDANGNLINKSQGGGFAVGASSASASFTLQGGASINSLPAPSVSSVTATGGASTNYSYSVTALDGVGGETTPGNLTTLLVGPTTLDSTHYNTVTWNAIPGAIQYNIYRCSGSGCTVAKLATVNGNVTSYIDNAAGSPSGDAPSTNTTGGAYFQGAVGIGTATDSNYALKVSGEAGVSNLTVGTGNTGFPQILFGNSGYFGAIQSGTGAPFFGSLKYLSASVADGNANWFLQEGGYATFGNSSDYLEIDGSGSVNIVATTAINLNQDVTVAAGKSLTFASGAGNFDQSASTGTFKTGSGSVSLNGDTTVASGKNLTLTGKNSCFGLNTGSSGTVGCNSGASVTTSRLEVSGHSWSQGGGANSTSGGFTSRLASLLHAQEYNHGVSGAVAARSQAGSLGDGGAGKVLQDIKPTRTSAPYNAQAGIGLLDYGINDIAASSGGAYGPFIKAMRTIIARYNSAAVYEESDASVTYPTGTWSSDSCNGACSGTATKSVAANGSLSIAVPSDFQGGTIDLGFVAQSGGAGGVHTFTVDGVAAGSLDTRNAALSGYYLPMVMRLTGLSSGAHTIVDTVSSVTTKTYFDYWQIEASSRPVLVNLIARDPAYTLYGSWPYTPTDSDVSTWNTQLSSLIGEFGSNVVSVDTDTVLAKNSAYFYSDNGHPNDTGHALLAKANYQALSAASISLDQQSTIANSVPLGGIQGVVVRNGNDLTGALQVQNASGSSTIFNVDTTNSRVGINVSSPTDTLDILAAGNTGVQILSGNSSNFTYIGVGRVSSEGQLGIAAANNHFLSSSVAGDLVLRLASGGRLLLGAYATANVPNAAAVTIQGQKVRVGDSSNPNYALDVIGSNLTSQIHSTDASGRTGAYLFGLSVNNSGWLTGGVSYDSAAWTARGTAASILGLTSGGLSVFGDTGLTSGNTYTPTSLLNLSSTGTLTVGTVASSGTVVQGKIALSDGTTDNRSLILQSAALTSASRTYTFPYSSAATDTICLQTLANCSGSGSGVTTVGALDGNTYSANGASVSGNSIYLQAASSTHVGLVTTGTQTFGGDKTFNGNVGIGSTNPQQGITLGSSKSFVIELAAPTGLSATPGTGGFLLLGTYYFEVVAQNAIGHSLGSNEASCTVGIGQSSCSLSWTAAPGATGYLVYKGTSAGGEDRYQYVAGGSSTSYSYTTDTGATTGASLPTYANGFTMRLQGNDNTSYLASGSLIVNGISLDSNLKFGVAGTLGAVNAGSGSNTVGSYLFPYNANNGFRSGLGLGTYFDGTNWIVNGDGSNNGGSAIVSRVGAGDLQFYTFAQTGGSDQTLSDSSFNTYERLRISNSGNVSIGNTNNTYKLDVSGAFRLQPSSAPTAAKGVVYFDTTANKFKCSEDGSTFVNCVGSGGTTYSGADFIVNGTSLQSTANFNIAGAANASPVAKIDVGSSTGAILQVGDGSFTGFVVNNSGISNFYGDAKFNGYASFGAGIDTTAAGSLDIGFTSGGNATGINLNQSTTIASGKNLTVSSGTVNIQGAPTASATASLIRIGSAIAGGNASANGGTYIGLNAPSTGAGSAADFLNLQANSVSKFKVTNAGEIITPALSTNILGAVVNINNGYDLNVGNGVLSLAKSGNSLALTGTPTASATSSLIRLGSAISGGNAVANGGTYIGVNKPISGAGSAADFINLQQAGSPEFSVDKDGNIFGNGSLMVASSQTSTIQGGLDLGVNATDYSLRIKGAPPANGAEAAVNLSNNLISGGNASGTYLGLNAPSTGAGSAADFLNFQRNGTDKFRIYSSGSVLSYGSFLGVEGASSALQGNYIDSTSASTLTIGQSNATALSIDLNTTFTSGKTLAVNGVTTIKAGSASVLDVQNTSNNTVFGVNTTSNQVLFGKANTLGGKLVVYGGTSGAVTIQTAAAAGTYTLTLPTSAGSSGDCLKNSGTAGTLTFGTCANGGFTRGVTMIPEYAGAVIRADGSNNNGTLTSDWDSTNNHNYYDWYSTQGTLNDYDIVIRNGIPSDYASGFGSFKVWVKADSTSTANDDIQISVWDGSGTSCASSTSILPGATTWTQQTVSLSGCSYAASDVLTIQIHLVSKSSNHIKVGEVSYGYTN